MVVTRRYSTPNSRIRLNLLDCSCDEDYSHDDHVDNVNEILLDFIKRYKLNVGVVAATLSEVSHLLPVKCLREIVEFLKNISSLAREAITGNNPKVIVQNVS